MQRLPTGTPNFKGARRQHRQSDYDLKKAILEFVDNVITNFRECIINEFYINYIFIYTI